MAPAQKITPAERIRELSDINKDVAAMLASAGQAVHALTNRPLHREDDAMDEGPEKGTSLDDRKEAFENSSTDFVESLQGIMAQLRRQVYALEEAGIAAAEPTVVGNPPPKAAAQMQAQRGPNNAPKIPPTQQLDPERIKNGGLGNFDVGWLNSRGNKVGTEKEAELIQEAKELIERVKQDGMST